MRRALLFTALLLAAGCHRQEGKALGKAESIAGRVWWEI